MGTWAGRTPSSTPRGRRYHERRGPCQGGARDMVCGGRQASTLPAAELTRGSRGQGTQDRPGRMGAARGRIWLLLQGGVSSPQKLPGLLPVTLGRWESGEPGCHPAPGDPLGHLCQHTWGREASAPAGQGALTRSVGFAGPQTRKPPLGHPTCVYWEPAESRVLR